MPVRWIVSGGALASTSRLPREASSRDHRCQRQKRANRKCQRENLLRVFSHGPLQLLGVQTFKLTMHAISRCDGRHRICVWYLNTRQAVAFLPALSPRIRCALGESDQGGGALPIFAPIRASK